MSDLHNQIFDRLGNIDGKLESMRSDIKGLKDQVTIANGRTRKLEDWKLKVNTRTGLISAIISGAIGLIVWLVSLIKWPSF